MATPAPVVEAAVALLNQQAEAPPPREWLAEER